MAILSCYYGYTNYFKTLNFPFSNIPRGFSTFEVLSPTINNSRNIKLQISYIFNSIAKFGTFSVTLLTLKSHFSLCIQNIKLKFSRFCNVKYCKILYLLSNSGMGHVEPSKLLLHLVWNDPMKIHKIIIFRKALHWSASWIWAG